MRRRPPGPVWALGAAMAASILLYGVHAVTGFGDAATDLFFSTVAYQGIKAMGVAIILVRAVTRRGRRLPWALLAAGFGLTLVGDLAWGLLYRDADTVPVPSIADLFYLAAYAPYGIGVALLVSGRRTRAVGSGLWLDGIVVALTLTTAMAYLVLPPLLAVWQDTAITGILTNAAYPLGDAVVVAALVAALALRNWQVDLRCGLLTVAFALYVATDAIYLVQVAEGTYTVAGVLDMGWLLAAAAAAVAAWLPTPPAAREQSASRISAVVPSLAGAAAIALLLLDHGGARTEWLPAPVAAIALLIFTRFSLVSHDNQKLIDHNRFEALTDALTGLANRRRLLADLAVPHARDRALILFDLDGFKLYNDTFGHPAGDALLQMIGGDLRDAVGAAGTAYRLGGDEFCAVLATDADPVTLGEQLAAAMARAGDGFNVGASFGATVVPAGAPAPPRTLTDADERLYACKNRRRSPADEQSAEVLLAVLAERTPDLGAHVDVVADLAASVARRLGMGDTQAAQVQRAAALHDIGKMAIPDAILHKPGPLCEDEWRLMRQHTKIGERILSAAPALKPVAEIVRSSHERWDGAGYPDGLAGDAIPLGARIVFACDAYDAMTAPRPYTRPRSGADALAELARCAGSQFDPRVVAALADELRERATTPVAPLLAAAT